eukprot:496661-Pleurochrysis_carterae.AAC.1
MALSRLQLDLSAARGANAERAPRCLVHGPTRGYVYTERTTSPFGLIFFNTFATFGGEIRSVPFSNPHAAFATVTFSPLRPSRRYIPSPFSVTFVISSPALRECRAGCSTSFSIRSSRLAELSTSFLMRPTGSSRWDLHR